MRLSKTVVVAAVAIALSTPPVAGAAPKNYCTDLKGNDSGQVCTITQTDPAYTISISFPSDYPDEKSIADFVRKTRDDFVNSVRGAPADQPHALEITSAGYGSVVPPRGSRAVVLKVYRNFGGPHPTTSFKAFNWDQTYRKPITWDTLWQPDADPLPVVYPIVQAEVQKQFTVPIPIPPAAGLDPANYQEFAVTNDGVIFFFGQDTLLPGPAGAVQVLVPRSAIDPMLA